MMKVIVSIFLIAFCALALSGCFYDKEELVYPQGGGTAAACDTTNVRYAAMQSLVTSRCSGCHTGASTSGTPLTTYTAVSAKASEMLRRVQLPTNHASFMPQGGSKLPDCEIAKIRTWIRNGKPQ